MTKERAEILTNLLTADADKAKKLLALDPNDALKEINSNGFDFTIEELNDYCDAFKEAVTKDELNADELENISGGIVLTAGMVWGLVGCFGGGAAIGIAAGAKW